MVNPRQQLGPHLRAHRYLRHLKGDHPAMAKHVHSDLDKFGQEGAKGPIMDRKLMPQAILQLKAWPRACQVPLCASLHATIVLESETTFTQFRKGLTGLTSRNCSISIRRHWQTTTLTAPCQRLNHTHPRSAACAHLRSADLQPRSPLWRPTLIHRRALHSATMDGIRPRHASGAAQNQGTN